MNTIKGFFTTIYTAFKVLIWMSLFIMPFQVWMDNYSYLYQLNQRDSFIQQFMHSELKGNQLGQSFIIRINLSDVSNRYLPDSQLVL